jgi:hypothetical protein
MTGRFLDPSEVVRAYRDPLSWVSLAVDLLPVLAVFAFGWGATPLVALYWLENLVIGAFTIFRMIGTAIASVASLAMALFMVPFFFFHYGMFCFVHGVFLRLFAGGEGGGDNLEPVSLIRWALGTAPEMLWFVAAIAAVSALYYVFDFLARGDYRTSNPQLEMFSPYGRIVTLHIAIILGAGVAFTLSEPLAGVLLLILIRVAFGFLQTLQRRRERDAKVAAVASLADDDA